MDNTKRAPFIKAIELSYDKWIKMTPKKNGELKQKTTYGKGLTVTRQTNTGLLQEHITVTNFSGVRVTVNFYNNPAMIPAKGIVIEVNQWNEHKYRSFIEIGKRTRHTTVIEKLKELLNQGFDRCPELLPTPR